MTRPRAYQVNDPGTHYTKFELPSVPSSSTMVLNGSRYTDFLNATVTQTQGGNEEPLPARIVDPTQEPFTGIAPGDQFGLIMTGVNSGNAMAVTFQAGDFVNINGVSSVTASKLALRINDTLTSYGVTYVAATNVDGYLNIVSATWTDMAVGADMSVTLTETGFTSGILQLLGFGAVSSVTASGSDATWGILTKTPDNRGGYFPLRYTNGESVLTQTKHLVGVMDNGGEIHMMPEIIGGQAIYGRLTYSSTPDFTLSFFAKAFAVPPLISEAGDFCSLNASDTIRIQVTSFDSVLEESFTITFDVNFDFTINTVADVVNAINAAWYAVVGDAATMVSYVPDPYPVIAEDTVYAYSGSKMTWTGFGNGNVTAKGAANSLNTIWNIFYPTTPNIASVYTRDGNNYLRLTSPNSSDTVGVVGGGSSRSGVNRLGLPYGEAKIAPIASVYGASEIKIEVPFSGTSDSYDAITIDMWDLAGSALTKLGLSGTPSAESEIVEVPATPSEWVFGAGETAVVHIEMLIPEVMELGDVPLDEMAVLQEFSNHGTTQQTEYLEGISNANRPVVYDAAGRISRNAISGIVSDALASDSVNLGSSPTAMTYPESPRISAPFYYDGTTSENHTLIQQSSPAPSSSTSSSLITQALRVHVGNDPDPSISKTKWEVTWNAKCSGSTWSKDKSGVAAAGMSFSYDGTFLIGVRRSTNNTSWSGGWDDDVFKIDASTPSAPRLLMSGDAVIATPDDRMTLSDGNIYGNTIGENYLSGSYNGAQYLRHAELDATDYDDAYSIMQSLNARATVTCGDGVNTFGDFNGTYALQAAINFIETAIPGASATIFLKAGVYKASSAIITSLNLSIIGASQSDGTHAAVIYNPTTAGNTITINRSGGNGSLYLKNVLIGFDGSATWTNHSIVSNDGAPIVAEDCYIKQIKFNNPTAPSSPYAIQGVFKRCRINNSGYSFMPAVTLDNVIGGHKIVFEDCAFTANYGLSKMIYIKAPDALSSAATFDGLRFLRCKFRLSYTTKTSSNLTINTGLIDLHPGVGTAGNNDARQNKGLIVKDVTFEQCDVVIHSPSSGLNVLLHLLPTANGTNADASPSPYMYIDNLIFEDTNFTHTAPSTADNVNAFTVAYGARNVTIRGGRYDVVSSTASNCHGIPTYDVSYAMHGGLSNGGPTGRPSNGWYSFLNKPWGSIAIMADDIRIEDFDLTGLLHLAGTADIGGGDYWYEGDTYLLYGRTLSIRDVTCRDYQSYAGATGRSMPMFRWHFYNLGQYSMTGNGVAYDPVGLVDGLVCNGKQASNTIGEWATYGHLHMNAKNLHITNSSVTGFKKSTGAADGGSGAIIYVFTNGLWDQPYYVSQCKVTNSVFKNLEIGIRATLFEGSYGQGGFEFSGNTIDSCSEYGIRVSIAAQVLSGIISKNIISNCGYPGIGFLYDVCGFGVQTRIVDNELSRNYSTDPCTTWTYDRQIHIFPLYGGVNRIPFVFVDRNTCHFFALLEFPGSIGVTLTDAGGAYVGITTPATLGNFYGLETGMNAFPSSYRWVNDGAMMRNFAILATPVTAI